MVQFSFENGVNLWFLLAVPLLFFAHYFFLHWSKRRALRFANFRALKRITGRNLMTRNHLLFILRIVALLSVIFAAAGATLWYEGESASNDFVILLDTSASMLAKDVEPTRMDASKVQAKRFIETIQPEARIGIVSFSGVSMIHAVPSLDRERLLEVVDSITLSETGGTDIPGAIITGTNLLLDTDKGRALILITDGSSTIETFLDNSIQRAVLYAAEQRVKVHAIGVGTNTGPVGYLPEYYNVSSVYNEENLLNITNATKGYYAHAADAEELEKAFTDIQEETNVQLIRRDLSPWLMLIALFGLIIEWILVNTRFRKIP
jgi:Ca-activated chloride channel family protein